MHRPACPIHAIGLQPLGRFDSTQTRFIQRRVSEYFHKPVIILDPIDAPASFINYSKGKRYSADSIISYLAGLPFADSISTVIGLTSEDIYITVRDQMGKIKEPESKYAVWGIFGLGSTPGHASVASDFRLKSSDTGLFHKRLITVVFHELGHNMGLSHCPHEHCLMNDAKGKISTIDQSSADFCPSCFRKLEDCLPN
jgi:archaemetzincin